MFNNHNAPIPTHYLREILGLLSFQENLFQFNENFSQTKMGGVIYQYFHGRNWNEISPTKRNQAKRMETLHWWLPLGLRQRRSRWLLNELTISILLSNSRPKYQRTKSHSSISQCLDERDSQKIQLEHQNPLQAERDLPIYALRLVPPTRRKTWFH